MVADAALTAKTLLLSVVPLWHLSSAETFHSKHKEWTLSLRSFNCQSRLITVSGQFQSLQASRCLWHSCQRVICGNPWREPWPVYSAAHRSTVCVQWRFYYKHL